MRASLLGSLLGILVCIHMGETCRDTCLHGRPCDARAATFCFTCKDQSSNWRCLRMTRCPDGDSRCLTIGTVSSAGNDTTRLITKKCADRCPSEQDPVGRASGSLFCCESSLCNLRPPK